MRQRLLNRSGHARGAPLRVGARGDPAERQADSLAAGAMSAGPWPEAATVPGGKHGAALPSPMQSELGQRFGHDLSRIRIHADERSETVGRSLDAPAFSVGDDLYFRRGRYNPGAPEGRRLLAHEIAHSVSARSEAAPVLRRAPPETEKPLGASDILPLKKGAKVAISQLLEQMLMGQLEDKRPEVAAVLKSLHGKTGEVVKADQDEVVVQIAGSLTIPEHQEDDPAKPGQQITVPAKTYNPVTIRLTKGPKGWELRSDGEIGSPAQTENLYLVDNMSAARSSASTVEMSREGKPRMRISTDKEGRVTASTYLEAELREAGMTTLAKLMAGKAPEPFLSVAPAAADVGADPNKMKEFAKGEASKAQAQTRTRAAEVSVGAAAVPAATQPLGIGFGLHYNLHPVKSAGSAFSVPLRFQGIYLPGGGGGGLLGASGGLKLDLTQIWKPLYIVFNVGAAGGAVKTGGEERQPFLGASMGGGLGWTFGVVKLEVRADALLNVLAKDPQTGSRWMGTTSAALSYSF